MNKNKLARLLLEWNENQSIRYPWVGESDPYKILLSEFLLQQTRSEQALPYYHSLLKAFPTVTALASAGEDDLLRLWQGLGYYSRARNLHKAAKRIVMDHNSLIPSSYDELLELPGIGPYTAAAIASFAFGESRPVVDGNVYRVLSRLMSIDSPVNTSGAHGVFAALAADIMHNVDPAAFNQALMNLGARVCTPKNPQCENCPWQRSCDANISGITHLFPVKRAKKPHRDRYFHYFDIRFRDKTIVEKREAKDIWQGLYQFPLIERASTRRVSKSVVSAFLNDQFGLSDVLIGGVSNTFQQTLSHQRIHARFYQINALRKPNGTEENFTLVFRKNLGNFALPRTITRYLNSISK